MMMLEAEAMMMAMDTAAAKLVHREVLRVLQVHQDRQGRLAAAQSMHHLLRETRER